MDGEKRFKNDLIAVLSTIYNDFGYSFKFINGTNVLLTRDDEMLVLRAVDLITWWNENKLYSEIKWKLLIEGDTNNVV